MPGGLRGERAALRAHARIDHHQVDGAGGEPVPGAREHVLAGADVARRNLMGDVDQDRSVGPRQQRGFQLAHVAVGDAEVGEEGNDAAGHAGCARFRQAPPSQNPPMATPRATDVREIAHQIPATPSAAAHAAARGMRRAERDELATMGQKV